MCRINSNKSSRWCIDTGLKIELSTEFGDFCQNRCGYNEAWLIYQLSQSNQGSPSEPRKSTDELPLSSDVTSRSSSAASRYIDAIHNWIQSLSETFFSSDDD